MTIPPIKAPAACAALALCVGASGAAQAGVPHRPTQTVYKANYWLSYELGSKRAIGYFIRTDGECHLTLVIAETTDPSAETPTSGSRLTLALRPGQSTGVASLDNESITLTCAADAETMLVSYVPPAGS